MTGMLADLLAFLGEHFYLVLIGCVELLGAVLLLCFLPRLSRPSAASGRAAVESEHTLVDALCKQDDEVWLLLRRSDLMPVYSAGNLAVLGVTLAQLQTDLACILPQMKEPEAGSRFWKLYRSWDGAASLTTQFETSDGQWFRVFVHRCEGESYDLFTLRRFTEEKQKENSYEQRLHRAEDASQFKTSFLFRMSHEIRTPMNGITGMLMLAEGKLPKDHPAMQYLTKANELSDHLLSLINDILDMSRIEAGKVELESQPFSLRELGGKLYDMFAKTLDAAGIHYAVNFEDLTVDYVLGDELRISQVIINFLSNAVKFTKQGEIVVTFRQMLLREGKVDLMVRVHDTGIGMQPEFISRIFRPFEQEDISTTRRFGGTGLGMAISDQLVKLMNGQIVVESHPGRGSDFSLFLSLPVTQAPAAAQAPAIADDGPAPAQSDEPIRCRILMAEDNQINAMVAVEVLQEKGAQVDVAENGQRAVDAFSSHPAGYYDLILMDIQMPVMDGHTAARTIRGLDRPDAARIPIYALSADAFVEDERLSRESGMNGHLTKPIDYEMLWGIIRKVVKEKETQKQ